MQRWLREYRQRGLSGLLQQKKSSGRPRVIPEEVVERLKVELSEPQGFSSYGEVQTWLRAECGIRRNLKLLISAVLKDRETPTSTPA